MNDRLDALASMDLGIDLYIDSVSSINMHRPTWKSDDDLVV